MLKRISAFFLMVVMLASYLVIPAEAASVFNRQKKNIFIVMDDSGSMAGTAEYDANYSLQSLIAMCDKEDTVNLFFLNSSAGALKKIDMSTKDNVVIQKVKTDYPKANGGTPYSEVKVAQTQLVNSASSGDETEYWLVVLTDGAFDHPNPGQDLMTFSQTKLANGTQPNVLLASIGGAVQVQNSGTLHYLSGTNIIKTMGEAAKLISGRVEVTPSYGNGNKEVTFNVPYPAKNIIVFSQNAEVRITSHNSSSNLDITENYNVEYPVPNKNLGRSTVCFVKEASGSSMAAGNITLTFDKPLVAANTVVLIEPAVGLTATFYNEDGQAIDPSDIRLGETTKIEYSLCDSETKKPLDASALGGNVKYTSTVDGVNYTSNSFEFEVENDPLQIDLRAVLPDGYVLEHSNTYTNLLMRREVAFTLSNAGNFTSDIDKLDGAEPIKASVLINGNPLTPEQFEDFDLEVKGTNFFTNRVDVEKDEANGGYIIRPRAAFFAIFTPYNKTYEVVLKDKLDAPQTATLTVEIPGDRNWLGFILKCLLILLIIYLIICQIVKPHFPLGTVFLICTGHAPGDSERRRPRPVSLQKLFLQSLWKSPRPWLHILLYFFTPKPSRVMILKEAQGYFKHFVFVADKTTGMYAQDMHFRKFKNNPDNYEPNFIKYTADFEEADGSEYRKEGIPLSVGEMLYKERDDDYPFFVVHTTRKLLKNGAYQPES